MKTTGILFGLLLGVALITCQTVYAQTNKPIAVYHNRMHSESCELIRLYPNQTFEHLRYIYDYTGTNCRVKRNVGEYQQTKSKLVLKSPEGEHFDCYYYDRPFYLKKNLFRNRLCALMPRRKTIFRKAKHVSDFSKPYYVHPKRNVAVRLEKPDTTINLYDLVHLIVGEESNDEEKALKIAHFITSSINYDREFLKTRIYACPQTDSRRILFDTQLAVCAGYSYVFQELTKLAGLKCKKISGYARNELNDISRKGTYHAWNIIWIDNEPKLYDVTWADGQDNQWLDVNPSIMIYSHFPDNVEDQLLQEPITFNQFKQMPIALPTDSSASINFSENRGTVYCDSVFRVSFSGEPEIQISLASNGVFVTPYRGDPGQVKIRLHKNIKTARKIRSGDSTHVFVPLKKTVTPLIFDIDQSTTVKYKVIKGNFDDLMKYHVESASNKIKERMAMGVVSAVYLGDEDKLAELTSDTCSVFFDEQGRYVLDKKVIEEVNRWDGNISHWIRVFDTESYKEGAKLLEGDNYEDLFQITDRLQFVFEQKKYKVVLKKLRLTGVDLASEEESDQ